MILKLLSFLSYTDDVVEKDIIRNTLKWFFFYFR
ncbi:biofilm development regulator YmgB/AriR family protein [Escherichia coli]|nr:biofilm development regulator YmgB/AriR family protein [Escherichia coli]